MHKMMTNYQPVAATAAFQQIVPEHAHSRLEELLLQGAAARGVRLAEPRLYWSDYEVQHYQVLYAEPTDRGVIGMEFSCNDYDHPESGFCVSEIFDDGVAATAHPLSTHAHYQEDNKTTYLSEFRRGHGDMDPEDVLPGLL
jgi:hypothetical protein